jgi:oxygen-independent coproporphyrinogen III oxidase
MISDQDISNTLKLTNSFGIYVHIPFCVHKCSYCDFYSFTKYGAPDFSNYTKAVVKEIRTARPWMEAHLSSIQPARSIFFGGGTPSLLPVDCLNEITDAILETFVCQDNLEFTIEANPETVTPELCENFRTIPRLNRISLGAQSFSSSNLAILERLGSPESIVSATKTLREFDLDNFNLDLIFGIPGQNAESVVEDVERAIALGPKHLSFYSLTLKSGHSLFRGLPEQDESAELYLAGVKRLAPSGFQRYEISNFAEPGHESQHNLLYWDGGDFLGVGPSAASRFFVDGKFLHRKNTSDFKKYVDISGFTDVNFEETTWKQTVLEATFLELRKSSGVEISKFQKRYGYDLSRSSKYKLFVDEGFLERQEDRLSLTSKGLMIADTVTADLAP